MSHVPSSLEQHLARWAEAYGADLAVPPGDVAPRAEAPPAAAAPAAEEAASTARREPPAAPKPAQTQAPAPRPTKASEPAQAPAEGPSAALAALRAEVLPCTRCKLHTDRRMTVFGEGSATARVMFVGEAPGAKEDQSGRPFVGPAGQLLDRIIQGAMGLRRPDVFIANINKCRPPNNRAPDADEVAACLPYLKQQVAIVKPEVIVCLGRTAAQNLLGSTESTTAMRRKQHEYAETPVIVTWHPAYLLREPSRKRETWEDIKKVNQLLGLPEVPTNRG
ncbi:MAG: uracil-DNA glycosylase family protein [Planctomycetota bacterium]|nr:uracil-DNA glycosylase family protein [Planctomycetota bacterium]